MKKTVFSLMMMAAVCSPAFLMTSCDRVKDAVEDVSVPVPFDIPLSFDTEIPFGTLPTSGYLTYPEIKMDVDLDARIKEKYPKLSINNVKSAKLEKFSIDLNDQALGFDLTAVKNARIYIKAPNLERKLVATVENNTNAKTIVFNPVSDDIIQYLSSKENSLFLEIQSNKLTIDKFNIKINPTFKISVGVG